MTATPSTHIGCPTCGFTLWNRVAVLTVSTVGLYNDARFPGRSILVLNDHHEDLTQLPADLAAAYTADLHTYAAALKTVTGSERLNYAILGNTEPHVHWHIFPRQPHTEPAPTKSPWDDPRPRTGLTDQDLAALIDDVRNALT